MKVVFQGPCLDRSFGRLTIAPGKKLSLRYHHNAHSLMELPLSIETVATKKHLVSVGRKSKVNVVEHLFSALYGLSMFHVRIDFWSTEVPFFDGSSKGFVDLLGGLEPEKSLEPLRLNREITIKQRDSFIQYIAHQKDELIIIMELSHPYIKTQKIVLEIDRANYIKEIAPARTFVFTDENDQRLQNLPPYGIAITKKRIYGSEPLRFSDELVRHKILDLLGDLFVLKRKLSGRIIGRNTSHLLNLKFAKALVEAT